LCRWEGPTGRRLPPFSELTFWLAGSERESATAEPIDTHLPFKAAKEVCTDRFERRYLAAVFDRFGRNLSQASQHADINRRHFRKLLAKHGLLDGADE